MDFKCPCKTRHAIRQTLDMVLFAVVCLLLASTGCSKGSNQQSTGQFVSNIQEAGRTKATEHSALRACPPGDEVPLRRGAPGTGDHRVILSWNASVPRPNQTDQDIGYCVYRSKNHPVREPPIKKPREASQTDKGKSPCQDCEQVNVVPVQETACVDDIAKNGTLYYYVAIAIDKDGASSFSNQARAKILGRNERAPSAPSSSYLFCRARDSAQQADSPPERGIH